MAEIAGYSSSNDTLATRTNRAVVLSIPVLCFIVLLLVVGTLGNVLVILTYRKKVRKSSTNIFIFCLSCFDLMSCCFVLSGEMFNILNPFTNDLNYLCKIQKFSGFALNLSSGFTIVCISCDRFMRIARPHHGLSICHAKVAIISIAVMSLILCSSALFVYGTEEIKQMPDDVLLGYRCGVTETAKETILPLLFTTIVLGCFGIAMFTLLLVYTRLGLKVKRWNKERNTKDNRQKSYFQPEESSSKFDASTSADPLKQTETFTFSPIQETDISGRTARALIFKRPEYVRQISRSLDKFDCNKLDDIHENGTQTLPHSKKKGTRCKKIIRRTSSRKSGMPSFSNLKRKIKLSKTTVMFIAATVAFVASHIPYVCVKITSVVRPDFVQKLTAVEHSLYMFAEYSFIISYGVNPLIYSFMNPKFRNECRLLLKGITATLKCRSKKFSLR